MIQNKSVLAIIPARGGSKGVPRKNIRLVRGRPLIAHTIDAALSSVYVDRLILSTDDDEIAEVASQYGCEVPFMREPELANDTATSNEVILDVLNRCPGYDYLVLLQPTSPLRIAEDIDACAEACLSTGAPACVTVTEARESPFLMYRLGEDQKLLPILPAIENTRRQDLETIYTLNGAVYFASTHWYQERKSFMSPLTTFYIMPNERSVDLDTEADFTYLKLLTGEIY